MWRGVLFVTDFTLPELGEDITSGDVRRLLVRPGDTLAKDQPVLELETDKATIEVPSPVAGKVAEINVKAGDTVNVGQVILRIDEGSAPPVRATAPEPPESTAVVPVQAQTPDVPETPTGPPVQADAPSSRSPRSEDREKVVAINRAARAAVDASAPSETPAPASPSVRRMARELGVDINVVSGSGAGGRISADDVKAHVSRVVSSGAAAPGWAPEPLPDFSRWGGVERQPMRAVRRKTAEHVARAWSTIPHVTQHDAADITSLEDLRQRHGKGVDAAGGKLTVTAFLVKVVAAALKKFPQFNASVDMAADQIVYKKNVHIGIAVDTDRGLLVPVIRDADGKNVTEIAATLARLSAQARAGKLSLEEMQGGSFSISNLGGIGGTSFTPIVNWPEVAILGVSHSRTEPVYRDGQFVPRLMLPLSLSYDHRAIDGADAVRFLRWIIEALEQPFLLML